jgi:uncharacterized membrane protein YkvA (DUF1232 family)
MNNTFFRSRRKAESVMKSPKKTKKLMETAMRLSSSGKYASQISETAEKIHSLVRMLRCYAAREYIDIPWQTIVLITAALIYFVSPFDAIADFIPFFGFADDIAIISAVFSSISQDVDRFTAWEAANTSEIELIGSTVLSDQ